MTIGVLRERGLSQRAIARQLGVHENAVRYRLRRLATQARDRRADKVSSVAPYAEAVAYWMGTAGASGVNGLALHQWLVAEGARRRGGREPKCPGDDASPGAGAAADAGSSPSFGNRVRRPPLLLNAPRAPSGPRGASHLARVRAESSVRDLGLALVRGWDLERSLRHVARMGSLGIEASLRAGRLWRTVVRT